jgi:hypothetical protein
LQARAGGGSRKLFTGSGTIAYERGQEGSEKTNQTLSERLEIHWSLLKVVRRISVGF